MKCQYLLLLLSHPFMSDSSQPCGLQHTRLPCPSPSSEVCPSSCPCFIAPFHDAIQPAISSSDALFFCPQSFPAWGTFPMSQLFTLDDENIRASASASVLPMSEDWLVWSPCCPGEFQESSAAPPFKGSLLWHSAFFTVQLSQPYVITGNTIALTIWTFVGRVMSVFQQTI